MCKNDTFAAEKDKTLQAASETQAIVRIGFKPSRAPHILGLSGSFGRVLWEDLAQAG